MEFGRKFLGLMILSAVFAVGSCKKKDDIPPEITIVSPNEGTTYAVYDTVRISFEISDETQLIGATAELVNSSFIPITPKASIQDGQGSAELAITDKLLGTGDYYVLITASDGHNEQREFRRIKIIAVPKIRRAIYVATGNGPGQAAAMWKVDSLFQQVTSWTQPGQDVLKLRVNSLYDKLTLVGQYSTGLRTYDIVSGTVNWSDDVFHVSQTERYEDLLYYGSTLYTTIHDREIRSYSMTGGLTMNLQTGNYVPELIYRDANYLLVEMNLVGDGRHLLNVYHPQTHSLLWQTEFGMDIISICALQNDQVLVFGNDGDQARVFQYDMGDNTWWEPRNLDAGKISKAVALEGGRFAISHANGIYAYTYSPNYLNLIQGGTVYQDIGFDADNGTIIAASGNLLEEMTQGGQMINVLSLADSIVSFDIHYTR